MFSYVSCEARVPSDHPLRAIRAIVDEALEVSPPAFEELYSTCGRPSIVPEKLLRALLLQAFYTIRSERPLMEQLDYNLLFRAAFVGDLRARKITPHIAIDGHVRVNGTPRRTDIDKCTTRHPGYAVSLRLRKRIEEGFGWTKTTGKLAKTRHRGLKRVGWAFTLAAAAYNLVRIPKLLAPT